MEERLHSQLPLCSESSCGLERAAVLRRVLRIRTFFIIRLSQPSLLLMFALMVQKQRWVKQLAPWHDSGRWHRTVSGRCILHYHLLPGGEKGSLHLRMPWWVRRKHYCCSVWTLRCLSLPSCVEWDAPRKHLCIVPGCGGHLEEKRVCSCLSCEPN